MPDRTRIKVCGMTDMAEARAAAAAGVDALGFIFAAASPRMIRPDKAREIIRTLPPFVDAVGVFMDESPETVREIAGYCGLTMVQLHGNETPEYCAALNLRVIKAFRIRPDTDASEFVPYAGKVDGMLLDTYHEKMAGGSGTVFDWQRVRDLSPPGPVILAGGLGPGNVKLAIRQAVPYAVDVNSGVENSPGRKDIDKIKLFVRAVGNADEGG